MSIYLGIDGGLPKKKLKIAIKALLRCVNPAGAYSEDRLEHAENTIEEVSKIAKKALDKMGVKY